MPSRLLTNHEGTYGREATSNKYCYIHRRGKEIAIDDFHGYVAFLCGMGVSW